MKNKTLLIMAAGMGSRFGGLKQIEPVGPNGEFIIDYSIYDAKKAGFNKVVFIIKEENYQIFKETIGKRVEQQIPVYYAFQKNDNLPNGFKNKEDRVKPWGTGHAILCCKDMVHENFAIINSDDFYGRDAFRVIANFLKENKKDSEYAEYAMAGYLVKNTLTKNGSVKRGICQVKDGYLTKLIESKIERTDRGLVASPLEGGEDFIVDDNDTVSMNMFGFTPQIFNYLEERFPSFLDEHIEQIDSCEYLIPTIVFEEINAKKARVEVLNTSATIV